MKKILTFSLMIVILFSCNTKKSEEFPQEKTEETVTDFELAQYVSGHTTGTIRPDAPIIIRFSNNIVSEDKIGEEEDKIEISISPHIAGQAVWDNRNVLKYKPHQDFIKGKTYNFRINIEDLIAEDVSIKPLVFKVEIMEQDIIEFNADFVRSQYNENEFSYIGSLNFLLPVKLEDVKQASIFKINNKELNLTWNGSETRYEFSSEPFERLEDDMPIYFRIEKDLLEMNRDFIRESSLTSLYEMAVILVKRIHEQQNPGIEIQFSDDLNLQQEISGYIKIEPDIRFSSKKLGNRIILNGDFEFGKSYQLTIWKGILNNSGVVMKEDHFKEISFNDENPQMVFAQSGCFLPSGNEKKIQFRTINLKNVNLKIKHVYENNLNFFLQESSLNSPTSNANNYYYSFRRVGEEVINEKLELGEVRNEWLVHELDLSRLIPEGDNGLYIIELYFNKEDIYYRGVETGNENYYTNPLSHGYYSRNGRITKPVILSDIGLTLKICADRYIVYATDLMTAEPLSGCRIELKTYQNQLLASKTTNGDGKAEFSSEEKNPFFVEAFRHEQRTILKTSEMIWNTSNFDVEGVQYSSRGLRAYTYTERGVYRPGDPINLAMIFRNGEVAVEDGHPVQIEVRNPRDQLIQNKVLNNGKDGFYNFNFSTAPTDPTGEWKVKIKVGGSVFYHILKIETVVAERLKIELTPKSESVTAEMEKVAFDLQANYLFGAPAANLKCQVYAEIYKNRSLFDIPRFRTFSFDNAAIEYKVIEADLIDSTLDQNGYLNFDWEIPDFNNAPTGLVAKLEATVSESGGRSSKEKIFLPIDPYNAYVGLQDTGRQWKKLKKSSQFKCILLDPEGIPLVGEDIVVKIYHNRYHWWWEYNNSQRHFKDDVETELLQVIKLKSKVDPSEFEFTPLDYGRYYVEVTHVTGSNEGHTAGKFFWGSYWGNPTTGMQDAGVISLNKDKQHYNPGDIARVSFDTPANSITLVSVEKADIVLDEYWHKNKAGRTILEIPVTDEMIPNFYVSVSILQPHEQTDNDRPIRMYGIESLPVFDSNTRQNITLTAPDELRPNTSFSCTIQTEDKGKTQFTIAVVDEGLLSLTDHMSPDAWQEFYKKQLLGVTTCDTYGYIIGTNKTDIYRSYSIGGSIAFDKKKKEWQDPEKTQRFKPVCMFQGPLFTDEKGYARVEFEMPEYMGAVRVMVLSAKGNRYGNGEKTIEVKENVVMLPTLPRMIAPGDKFTIPVEVFATKENVGKVEISMQTSGPISILNDKVKHLEFMQAESQQVSFEAEVPMGIGEVHLEITASYSEGEVKSNTNIAIKPLSAKISTSEMKVCARGETIKFDVPDDGISGTNEAILNISRLPKADLSQKLHWLIRYPYGCVEQTISAVFPQLYLREFLVSENFSNEVITDNINKGIRRLQKFQLPNGSFSSWPGNTKPDYWGTNYAGHFMLAAREAGYHVPGEIFNNWIRFQQTEARNYKYSRTYYYAFREQLYRLYLLALAGKPEIGAMNYLWENYLSKMDDTERWILAASYKQAGIENTAKDIAMTTRVIVEDYKEMSGTYGSALRDKAMILDAMITLGEKEEALQLYLDLSEHISQDRWFSTQETGYTLLALGRYIKENYSQEGDDKEISGNIRLPDGSLEKIHSKEIITSFDLSNSIGKEISFTSTASLKDLYVTLNWSGIPIKLETEDMFQGLKISNSWQDKNGHSIDPQNVNQGDIFMQTIEVTNLSDMNLENVALTQILPSGWEIENDRLDSDGSVKRRKNKTRNFNLDYTDIRDDRVMWFFNINPDKKATFTISLRAVTSGEFFLPATYCEVMYNNHYQARKAGMNVKVSTE